MRKFPMNNPNADDDFCAFHGGDVAAIYWSRSQTLCDVGGDGYLAAAVIGPDGVEYPLVVDFALIGDPDVTFNPNCPDAPHEQVGPLPAPWRRRIDDQPEARG
jgi:hypothetical protein